MSGASGSIGQLSYGSFYVSSLAFGYFSTQQDNPLLQFIPHTNLPGPTLEPIYLFYALTAVAFLGAVEAHGIARAIYGPEGPTARPKHKTVQVKHELAIVLGVNADKIPVVPCRIAHRGFVAEFLDYIVYRSRKLLYSPSMKPREKRLFMKHFGTVPPRHRLEIGVEQLTEFRSLLKWRQLPRVIYFAPLGLLKYMMWLSFAALIAFAVLGTASYAILLLILAHVALLFRNLFWAPIPDYINADAVDDRFVPEYKMHDEEE